MMTEVWVKSIREDSLNVDFLEGGGGGHGPTKLGTTVTHRKGMFCKMLYGILSNVLLSFILFY
jgi:hypothetical protein